MRDSAPDPSKVTEADFDLEEADDDTSSPIAERTTLSETPAWRWLQPPSRRRRRRLSAGGSENGRRRLRSSLGWRRRFQKPALCRPSFI